MREYTVRRCFLRQTNKGFKRRWVSVWDDKGYTRKFTMEEAEEEIEWTFNNPQIFGSEVVACRIYKGKEMIKEIEA